MTQLEISPSVLAEYDFDFDTDLAISSDVADLLFRDAHTANAFSDTPVSEAQLRAVYDLVKWGPTAMNTQPLRVALIQSDEARERLVAQMAEGNKAKTLAAPVVAVLAADLDFHDEMQKVFPVFPGAKDAFADEAKRTGAATLNTSLQIGYFIIGVRAAGLAAGPMGGFDADGVSREFFPDGRHRAMLVVNIGQPSEEAFRPRQPRLNYDEVVSTH